jgi:moderate conductance mechanosensitive channel
LIVLERLQRMFANLLEAAPSLVITLLVTILALWLVRFVAARVSIGAEFSRHNVRVQTLRTVIASSLRALILLSALAAILSEIGVNVTALLAGVSILGLAVSFGAQSLVKDVITGFFVLLEDQYGVGDVVRVNGATGLAGSVEHLNLRVTVLRDLEGTAHIIPNGQILTVSVLSKDWARVVADIDVPHDLKLDTALELIGGVAQNLHDDPIWTEKFLEAPEVLGVQALGAVGVTIRTVMKVQPKEQWGLSREFKKRIKNAFDAAGLRIPMPQMNLNMPKDNPRVTAPDSSSEPSSGVPEGSSS